MEQKEIFVKMALVAWNMQISRTTKFFDSLSDEELLNQVAPGRNRIIYLLGHLVAVNDNIIALFGIGKRSYAHLDEAYITNPDSAMPDSPDPSVLRNYWKISNEELTAYFNQMSADEWFSKHTAMTDEDFVKEPTRNKLSVLLNRTSHVAYHLGQLVLAK